jgi:hypothetical protein
MNKIITTVQLTLEKNQEILYQKDNQLHIHNQINKLKRINKDISHLNKFIMNLGKYGLMKVNWLKLCLVIKNILTLSLCSLLMLFLFLQIVLGLRVNSDNKNIFMIIQPSSQELLKLIIS